MGKRSLEPNFRNTVVAIGQFINAWACSIAVTPSTPIKIISIGMKLLYLRDEAKQARIPARKIRQASITNQ